ncbi:metal-dependent hydrolase family protein [Lysinibacter cavernae]|uniref:Imidazolonepropionase-like amidohydrolase n=1 Tax=Lysinibacter cavernae TaxID=1640652 RepID=A0A7X5TVE1_9MICO|nr:amidohydrolase family protein [Lysinibacter cavernae]NIH54862.1 imidazolonepropionase-like amidohydrolase [Lysinibacter cavernae]
MTQASTLTIVNAVIFDGVSETLVEGGIRIVDGVITDVGAGVVAAGGEDVYDAEGRTVVPGMIDAHFHAYAISLLSGIIEKSPKSYVALKGSLRLEDALRRGFTTVRDVAGGDQGLARAVREGLIPSPRYFFTGPGLSQTGGHGDPRDGELNECLEDGCMTEVVDGVEAIRHAVRERLHHGAHAIKIMASGGVISLTDPIRIPQYSNEEVQVAVAEATRRGSYVAAHAYSPEAIRHSVENGVRSIEHGNLLDAETAQLMAEHDAFLVPTLAAYDAMDRRGAAMGLPEVSQAKNKEVLVAGQQAIVLARAAGVQIGFGSDLMGDLADDQLRGLVLQIEVDGVLNALRSVTSVNAALLQQDNIGRIAEGFAGDVVVFDGNPFEQPELITDEQYSRVVVQNGAIVSR